MLTKRDKILVRPWEQRKYENHLRKVQTALPVIDNKPPPEREHVSVKLKKRQKEIERIRKIEYENLILLRKMNYIMKTSRVDNYWTKPLPNFLNRVSIYDNVASKQTDIFEDFTIPQTKDHVRKSKCSACTPQTTKAQIVPEERVPWDPPKPNISRKRSKSVPVRKNSLPTIVEKEKPQISDNITKPKSTESRVERSKAVIPKLKKHKSYEDCFKNSQKLILTRGSLKLCVNFPSDTQIKLQSGSTEKMILRGNCYCKNIIDVY